MRQPHRRQLRLLLLVTIPALTAATVAVAILQTWVGIPDPSAVYLVAVVVTAIAAGAPAAVIASVASFLLYDYFFVQPTFTLTISDPAEWLSVVLLLFVGIVVGQLAALQRSRTQVAEEREREARALFEISRTLATRESTPLALGVIARELRAETGMHRVWLTLGTDDSSERVVADTGEGPRPTRPPVQQVLQRTGGGEPGRWLSVHQSNVRAVPHNDARAYRVRVEAGGRALGSIWGLRDRHEDEPDATETRLLAAAADQVGQTLLHDRLAAESQAAELARQSDALKSALLQSVSHDLRTPLATIRAAAGTLRPGMPMSVEDREYSVAAIDREVEYLNRLVTNLLDLSRIEAGALRAERDVFELDDLVGRTLERLRPRLGDRPLAVELSDDPVEVDPTFVDAALTNILENAVKYTPADTAMRIHDSDTEAGYVRLSVEDAGPGVPDAALPRIFEKFYRVPGGERRSRSGTGIGLAVVQGLIEASGGRVWARRSDLGGLAIDLDLPRAAMPAELPTEALR